MRVGEELFHRSILDIGRHFMAHECTEIGLGRELRHIVKRGSRCRRGLDGPVNLRRLGDLCRMGFCALLQNFVLSGFRYRCLGLTGITFSGRPATQKTAPSVVTHDWLLQDPYP